MLGAADGSLGRAGAASGCRKRPAARAKASSAGRKLGAAAVYSPSQVRSPQRRACRAGWPAGSAVP